MKQTRKCSMAGLLLATMACAQVAARDTVWVAQMTAAELRDAVNAGKTNVLVMAGGMEDNGPYVEIAQHNGIVRELGERIARRLGNTLVAPVIEMGPGVQGPGSIALSETTYKALLTDVATSLRAQGFRQILLLADHDPDAVPAAEVARTLTQKWKGTGVVVRYVPEYYNYPAVAAYSANVLGNREKPGGVHEDYYVDAISAASDPEAIRLQERIRAGRATVNGIDLGTAKAQEDGNKIIEFRVDAAVKAIRKLLGETKR